jgi:type VI secretion system protein ImpB
LGDRKFVEVTPDNFDQVLEKMSPHLAFSVDNKLSKDAGQLKVNLNFKELADFEPEQVATKIEPLKKLLDLRTKLSDLRGSLQGNDKLDEMLHDVVSNTEKRQQLSSELGLDKDKGGNNG